MNQRFHPSGGCRLRDFPGRFTHQAFQVATETSDQIDNSVRSGERAAHLPRISDVAPQKLYLPQIGKRFQPVAFFRVTACNQQPGTFGEQGLS